MNILYDMRVSKLSGNCNSGVNYSFKSLILADNPYGSCI